jgi:hypothetical protein
MDRSLYPNGCIVDQVALRRTETSKANEILRGRTDWTSRGVYTGGEITVNAVDDTKVDVAQFGGFAPNGEYIASTSDYFSISLSDYTLNTVNLLVAVYCENYKNNVPHETDGESYPSYAEASLRVRAYTEAEYVALPTTDANLANDAQDRCLILGKITANGAGVALTTSSIQSPTEYDNILYATPLVPTTITGVTILGVSSGTATGDGTLEYYNDGVGNLYLRWSSSASIWAAVAPPGTGWEAFTSDEIRSIPDPSGEYVRIQVVVSELPTSPITTIVQETITITNLYYQEIPRLTAEDVLHRNLQGTGTPTPQNPHGMSLNDFTDSDLALLNEHQDIMHSNGVWKGSNASCMECTVSFPVAGDQLNITEPTSADLYYINGVKLNTIDTSSFLFIPSVVPTSASGVHFYEVSVSDSGSTAVNLKMSFSSRNITGVWVVGSSESYPAGTYDLSLTVSGATSYAFSWDSGESVTVTSSMDSQVIRLYAENNVDWIDLFVNINDASGDPDGQPIVALGVYTDPIVVYASLDWSQHLHLCSVCGWWNGSAAPARFQIGYKPYDVSRSVVDTRLWGTLAVDNLSDSALQDIFYSPQDELHESGVLYKRNTTYYDFDDYGASGLAISIRGGSYYCRGKRLNFSGDNVLLSDNAVNLVYLDSNGNLDYLDVTTDFAGDVEDALAYIIGGTKLTPPNSAVYHATDLIDPPERGVALYQITTSGGSITGTINVMRNVNGPVDAWSVAQFSTSALASFDSLYTAFMYANLRSSRDYKLTIKLTGQSYISSVITQPTNVEVEGNRNSTLTNIIVNYVSASGVWVLSSGCSVRNVSIANNVSGVAIALHNYCTISGCSYTAGAVAFGDTFLYSGSSYSGIKVFNNSATVQHCFISASASSSTSDIWVENNQITQYGSNSSPSSLIYLKGKNFFVSKNHITTDNNTSYTIGILVYSYGDSLISENIIEVGEGDDSANELAISVVNVGSYSPKIINNTISRVSGDTFYAGLGIYVVGRSVDARGNKISNMGGGICLLSTEIADTNISDNTLSGCYHFGVKVYTSTTFSSLDNLTISDNQCSGMTKNSSGSALSVFGTGLYGIYLKGTLATTVTVGNVNVSGNEITTLSNDIGSTYGVVSGIVFDVSAPITAGIDCFAIDGNKVKDLASTNNSVYALDFTVAAGAGASTLLVKGVSISNNQVKSVSALSGDAYGIYSEFHLDSSNTTLLEGLCVNGNSVSGFYGHNDASGVANGIRINDVGPLGSVFGFTCNSNTVGTISNNTVASGTNNDSTYVCGIHNSLKNSVISNNTISIVGSGGSASTARGDGIRCYANGTTVPTIRSVISGNSIQVNWAGIHAAGVSDACIFEIIGNKINSGSVGIYVSARSTGSVVSSNDIYVAATNDWEAAGCLLTGAGGIVCNQTNFYNSSIENNYINLVGSSNTYSANIWAEGISALSIVGNRTNQSGAVVGGVFHIYAYNCTGCVSISENVVDNSARSGASGIWYTLPFDVASLVSMNNNKIFASNNSGGSIYEFYMDLNSGGTLAQGFALGNVVAASYGAAALPKVGLVNPYPSAGTIVNVTRSTVYFKDFSSADAWVYSESNMCTNSAGLVDWW